MGDRNLKKKARGWINHNGYRMVYAKGHPVSSKDGVCLYHRKVAWDAGKLKDISFSVHHIDGNKFNNRIDNLQVICPREHTRMHKTGKPNSRRNAGYCLYPGCAYPTACKYGICKRHYDNLKMDIDTGRLRPYNRKDTIKFCNFCCLRYLFYQEFIRTGDMKPTHKYKIDQFIIPTPKLIK